VPLRLCVEHLIVGVLEQSRVALELVDEPVGKRRIEVRSDHDPTSPSAGHATLLDRAERQPDTPRGVHRHQSSAPTTE